MHVTDSDRFAIAMAKLSEARNAVYQATRIIENLFEVTEPQIEGFPPACEVKHVIDYQEPTVSWDEPVDGLYPGQKLDPEKQIQREDEENQECLE